MISVLAETGGVSPIRYNYFCRVPKAFLKYGDYKVQTTRYTVSG